MKPPPTAITPQSLRMTARTRPRYDRPMARILVIGGTGNTGAATVAALAELGHDATPAARNPPPGGVAVDLARPETVREAAHGHEAAYLTTPIAPNETELGLTALEALRSAGVRKLVYLSVMHPDALGAIPHVANKLPIRDAVVGMGGVVLEPGVFFQNDLFALEAIRAGVYPMPYGRAGVSAVDVADIGRAAARALTRPDWDGSAVPVCGPEALTADDLAANWAHALGRPVAYAGDAVEPFLAAVGQVYPGFNAWMAEDFATMMRLTQAVGCAATPDELAQSQAIIGRPPRSHRAWVEDTVQQLAREPV